jgi:hypothetical protein
MSSTKLAAGQHRSQERSSENTGVICVVPITKTGCEFCDAVRACSRDCKSAAAGLLPLATNLGTDD